MFLKKEQRKTINVYKIQHLVNTAQRMICLSGGPRLSEWFLYSIYI